MDILDDIREMQRGLVLTQVGLSELAEELSAAQEKHVNVEITPSFEIVPGGVLIVIPEFPPRIDIFNKTEIKGGKLNSRTYRTARDRWKSLIRKAVENYNGPRIEPALVYITYYVPKHYILSNFLRKFIVDALRDYGVIATDSDFKKVNTLIEEARQDKKNPRTEIMVLKNDGSLKALILQKIGGSE